MSSGMARPQREGCAIPVTAWFLGKNMNLDAPATLLLAKAEKLSSQVGGHVHPAAWRGLDGEMNLHVIFIPSPGHFPLSFVRLVKM